MPAVKYNSKSETYKKPFGAAATESDIEFTIEISKCEQPDSARFVYRKDGTDAPIYISMHKNGEYDNYYKFSCKISFESPDLYFYRFEYDNFSGTHFVGNKGGIAVVEDWLPEWQLTVYDKNFKTPDWVKGGIMYQIFPDRFCRSDKFSPAAAKNPRKIHENWYDVPEFIYNNPDYKSNDYFCGNIDGVIEKLGYLKSLGVSIIYFNPIFESPEYHRYSTANYFNTDPYFGTNEQFKILAKKCGEIGIKIILDGVFSHTGADSIYFNRYVHYESNGADNSESSPYRSWYNFTEYPNKYECWWGFENLPNVNETNPEYLEYITGEDGVVKYWQSMGASGWRLDVADELPDEFLDSLYKRAKKTDSESFVIGEVWEDATNKLAYGVRRRYLLGGQMDSVMNYPWRTAVIDFVTNRDEQLFNDRIMSVAENYPPQVLSCLMNSISTHDTVRAITLFGVNHDVPDEQKGTYQMTADEYENAKKKLLFAVFLQFTLPGIPSIYYGDEAGLQGFRDPYCRMGYPFGTEDSDILDFHRKIAKVRCESKSDFTAGFKPHHMQSGFYSFFRGNLLCAVNLGSDEVSVDLNGKKVIFFHGCTSVTKDSIKLSPNSAVILK